MDTPRVEDLFYLRPHVEQPTVTHAIMRPTPIPRFGAVTIPAVAVPRVTFPEYVPSVSSGSDFPASMIFGDPVGSSTRAVTGQPYEPYQVERTVRPGAGNPSPTYPSTLRSAGVEGDVLVRFVVDTLGRVEPGSVEIREFTHALFADAVREWLRRTHYDPASIGGRPVRQLVEQRVGFTLRR
jgi:TonB family protein